MRSQCLENAIFLINRLTLNYRGDHEATRHFYFSLEKIRLGNSFFPSQRQMKTKVYIVLGVAIVLFLGYVLVFRNSEQFAIETPAPAEIVEQAATTLPERVISPAGPNPPAQRAPVSEPPVRVPEPEDRDPYADPFQKSTFEDEARAPERSFGPAPLPTVTDIRRSAGIDSVTVGNAPATDQFNPESAQNGGEFMGGGIFANDTDVPTNFSAF
jgi:hypothetical protein